jgi:hypothetical protein
MTLLRWGMMEIMTTSSRSVIGKYHRAGHKRDNFILTDIGGLTSGLPKRYMITICVAQVSKIRQLVSPCYFYSLPSNIHFLRIYLLRFQPVDHIVNDLKAEWSHPGNSTSLGYYVPEGTTARLRFINMAAFSEYYVFFAVGGVPLTTEVQVVELDGVLVDRLPNTGSVTGFSISSGQRVSILFSGLPAGESIQVIFISEPRINAGNSNCPLIPTWTSPPNGAQYSWTHVDSVLVDPIRNAPPANTFDGKHSDGTLVSQLMLRQWTQCTMVSGSCLEPPACDYNPRPYFTQRVKVPMNYQDREVLAKGTCEGTGSYTVLAPTDAFGFNDYYYTARDNEPAWIVDTPNFSWIHPIYMVDHTSTDTNKGKGEMGSVMESAPLVASDLPNSL